MTYLQILVVDDSLITVKKLSSMLTTLGHRVVRTAGTGQEALVAYEAYKPDLVTMDITMPDMDGIEATRQIRAKFPDALIIMVTSHGQEKMVLDALKAGAKGYVLKPFREDKLKDVIETAVKRSIRPDKLQAVIEKTHSATPDTAE
jgi:two-component system chemotaxis response regulator CheY